ncbi:hypothetical protein BHE74_00023203 [Ensete ventricosum]|nr:hypothetical protein BHE74_00023203 [Ensete ventricosum]
MHVGFISSGPRRRFRSPTFVDPSRTHARVALTLRLVPPSLPPAAGNTTDLIVLSKRRPLPAAVGSGPQASIRPSVMVAAACRLWFRDRGGDVDVDVGAPHVPLDATWQ